MKLDPFNDNVDSLREGNYANRHKFFRKFSLEDRRTVVDMQLLYDVMNAKVKCPKLTARIGLRVGRVETRQARSSDAGAGQTNYAKHSVLHRLVGT
ncbi:hypothetical protein EVAR_64141_1 [Eumeta japonica]|uniref:Uncharacterized protein n=1 Tax=Eumeta variegata TaxID=151549 RepID=A0A4C2A3B5_EUMVA|nr:hypothetical protein EVAR_64141_1 [Eumeta japonica]